MLDRRQLLVSAAATLGAASLGKAVPGASATRSAERTPSAGGARVREVWRLLRRAGYGPRPGELERVLEKGADAWIEDQLAPESLPDLSARWRTRRVELAALSTPDLFLFSPAEVLGALRKTTLLRAVYSERQLNERLVELWSDHFSVAVTKGDVAVLVAVQDREVIRPHALGRFGDLLRASLASPALLVSLDGRLSRKGRPNENHARELLELHSLGVHGGYSQVDVKELARLLTGFSTRRGPFRHGMVAFRAEDHDRTGTRVLGAEYRGTLEADVDRDLDELVARLVAHPSTARHVASRLCRRFIGDPPPEPVLARAAAAFASSRGDIRKTLEPVLRSEEIRTAPARLSRPYGWLVSLLRSAGAATDGGAGIQDALAGLGQAPFGWPFPDGYPEAGGAWTASILPRWNLALALARGEVRGTRLPSLEATAFLREALARDLSADELGALARAPEHEESLAAALCHPELLAC